MIGAVAIGNMDVSNPSAKPAELRRRDAHKPHMRDVHRRLDVFEANFVEEPLHCNEGSDKGEFKRQQFDGEIEPARRGVFADLAGRIHDQVPLEAGGSSFCWNMYSPGTKQRFWTVGKAAASSTTFVARSM